MIQICLRDLKIGDILKVKNNKNHNGFKINETVRLKKVCTHSENYISFHAVSLEGSKCSWIVNAETFIDDINMNEMLKKYSKL